MAKNIITLKTFDNDIFEIEEIVAEQSETINRMIIDNCADSIIPLPNITSETFVKVIEYCERHATATPNLEKERLELRNFNAKFINVGQEILYDLITATNYLEIKSLLDLTCRKVADMLKGKSPEEIREIFNIENDFTLEEEEEIRRKNIWAFQ